MTDLIRFQCSGCGKSLTAKPELSGKRLACPACKNMVDVPVPLPPEQRGAEVVQAEVVDDRFKNCPYCGEPILATAIKCKHCRKMLPPPVPQPMPEHPSQSWPRGQLTDAAKTSVALWQACIRGWASLDRRGTLLVVCGGLAAVALLVVAIAVLVQKPGHEAVDKAMAAWPRNEAVDKGMAAWEKGARDLAIADFSEAIRLDPTCAVAYQGAWVCLQCKGRIVPSPCRLYGGHPARSAKSENGRFLCEPRALRCAKGEFDEALADFTEAIRLDPKCALAYLYRGYFYNTLEKGEWDLALADFTEAIRLDPQMARGIRLNLNPQMAWAYANRGIERCLKNEFDEAIADCSKAIRLDPKCAFAYSLRSLAYEKKGDTDKARRDHEQGARLRESKGERP